MILMQDLTIGRKVSLERKTILNQKSRKIQLVDWITIIKLPA